MYTNELDSLPEKLKAGIITKEQAAMKVMEILYTNPYRYNLQGMDEDDRSDFLIDALPKFGKMIERHCEKVSPFGAYLYISIPGLKKSWFRRRNSSEQGQRAMKNAVKGIYEETREQTLLAVASPNPADEYGIYNSSNLNIEENSLAIKRIFKRQQHNAVKTGRNIHQKRSAMILALKSAWYIDDKQIGKVSEFCGCSRVVFEEKIEDVRQGLVEKSEKQAALEKKRDRAWYFICKYREELSRLDSNSEAYKKLKRKLEYQINSWKNKNSIIKKGRKIAPDNYTVARALNLPEHQITAYINYAKKMVQDKGENL